MKVDGQHFTNSKTCQGESFTVPGAPLDIAEITITGRYPESGWARNKESHEMVRVQSGNGQLLLKSGETTELSQGEAVHVPPGIWFAWNGDMTITMACSPAFKPEQYEAKEAE